MIREVKFWKDDILEARDQLARIAKQRVHGQKTKVSIEKALFVTFYAIRKLLENGHIPPALASCNIPVEVSPRREDRNWQQDVSLDCLFDVEHSVPVQMGLKNLCHQFVHSAVFVIQLSHPTQITGFFVASESMKKKECYHVSLERILHLFKQVGESKTGGQQAAAD